MWLKGGENDQGPKALHAHPSQPFAGHDAAASAAVAAGAAGMIPASKEHPELTRSITNMRIGHTSRWHQLKSSVIGLFDRLPIFHPDSPGKLCWDLGLLMLVMYNAFVVRMPSKSSFPRMCAVYCITARCQRVGCC